jgi:hypothetical protein
MHGRWGKKKQVRVVDEDLYDSVLKQEGKKRLVLSRGYDSKVAS